MHVSYNLYSSPTLVDESGLSISYRIYNQYIIILTAPSAHFLPAAAITSDVFYLFIYFFLYTDIIQLKLMHHWITCSSCCLILKFISQYFYSSTPLCLVSFYLQFFEHSLAGNEPCFSGSMVYSVLFCHGSFYTWLNDSFIRLSIAPLNWYSWYQQKYIQWNSWKHVINLKKHVYLALCLRTLILVFIWPSSTLFKILRDWVCTMWKIQMTMIPSWPVIIKKYMMADVTRPKISPESKPLLVFSITDIQLRIAINSDNYF